MGSVRQAPGAHLPSAGLVLPPRGGGCVLWRWRRRPVGASPGLDAEGEAGCDRWWGRGAPQGQLRQRPEACVARAGGGGIV